MKIQLVNTFFGVLSFTTLFPFPRSITARITVRVGASVLWFCGSRVLSHPFYTPQHISQSMFAQSMFAQSMFAQSMFAIDVCDLSGHVISISIRL